MMRLLSASLERVCSARLPMPSISSMKMMHGACLRAVRNSALTFWMPTPKYIEEKSLPVTWMKLAFDSLASALASWVLPVPGSPVSSTPLGGRAPRRA